MAFCVIVGVSVQCPWVTSPWCVEVHVTVLLIFRGWQGEGISPILATHYPCTFLKPILHGGLPLATSIGAG